VSVAEAWGKLEARRRVAKLASGQRGRLGSRREGAARGTGRASGASGGPERAAVARRAPSAEAYAVFAADSTPLSTHAVAPTTLKSARKRPHSSAEQGVRVEE